jgi:hypothetical protein
MDRVISLKSAVSPQTVLFALVLPFLLAGLGGCQKQDQQPPPKAVSPGPHNAKKPSTVIVPPAVAGKWKAVRIAVVDKTTVTQKVYTIPIGGKQAIPSSAMTIKVESYLPAFIMEGSVLTSASNEPTNPAVKVEMTEKGTVLFTGWLFSKFPSTHAFMHPRYGFSLVDAIPADK